MKKQDTPSAIETAASVGGQVSAWVLTATALLVSTERLMHHQEYATVPATAGEAGHHAPAATENLAARAEGARETARLPEEYDVGLREPTISGL